MSIDFSFEERYGVFSDEEELEFLRSLVMAFIESSQAGRETMGDSFQLDMCWYIIHEYVDWRNSLKGSTE